MCFWVESMWTNTLWDIISMIKEEHPILKEMGTQRHKLGVLFSSLIKMRDDNNHIVRSLGKQETTYL